MPERLRGNLDGKDLRVGIVVSRWNAAITDALHAGALRALLVCGVPDRSIVTLEVPGAFEIPIALDRLAKSGAFDCLVALGCVVKGETAHFEYVANSAMEGVREVSLTYHLPITCGVLATYTMEQAEERAGNDEQNKGSEAVLAAIELVNTLRLL